MIQDSVGNTYITEEDDISLKHKVHINDLPAEVLLNVFCNLSPVDLRDLRLVCRQWNEVVLDKAAWIRAFDNRFHTGEVFASVTGSKLWILEYFGRVALLRTWAKAKSISKLYSLNSEYVVVDRIVADFIHDRLLIFSHTLGTVTSCTLSLGKNQVFIPEHHLFSRTLVFDVNWNFLCVCSASGEVYSKNLITATSSGSQRLSVSNIANLGEPVIDVKLNPETDKYRERTDIVLVTSSGGFKCLNLNGRILFDLALEEPALFIDTDFKKSVVVLTTAHIFIIDFQKKVVIQKITHGWEFDDIPPACDVDFYDLSVVLGHNNIFKVFHISCEGVAEAAGEVAPDTIIIDGTIQNCSKERDDTVAGGDGRLYALTLSDGSVCVFELRETKPTISIRTRIMPFTDDRTPQNIESFTKVALNSSVIAIGALADWLHFYDAHSGHYLREAPNVSRKLTHDRMVPILSIKLAPNGTGGVVVSGDLVQYFRFGDLLLDAKRPNAPQASDLSNKRAIQQHIKTQLDEYQELEHNKHQAAVLADKFNGTTFESEQEELRVAMALSASTLNVEDSDLAMALALLREDLSHPQMGRLHELDDWSREHNFTSSFEVEAQTGSSKELKSNSDPYSSEDETLQRVLKLSLLEN